MKFRRSRSLLYKAGLWISTPPMLIGALLFFVVFGVFLAIVLPCDHEIEDL